MKKNKNIVIFTGAGISTESGISTFRDSGGLWEEYKIEDICSAGCLDTNYDETIEFYDKRREDIKNKFPNKAHKVISKLKSKYPNDINVITQNVDNLFEKAGCKDVLHLHGFLTQIRCKDARCDYKDDIEYKKLSGNCPKCGSKLRPNVIFFGEQAPKYQDLQEKVFDTDMMIVIGTSGNVINVDGLLMGTDYSILNNLEKSDAIYDDVFNKVIYDKATIAIDEIEIIIEKILNKKDNKDEK